MSSAVAIAIQGKELTPRASEIMTRLNLEDESILAQTRQAREGLRADNVEFDLLKAQYDHNRKAGLYIEASAPGGKNHKKHPVLGEQHAKLSVLASRIQARHAKLDRYKNRKSGGMVEAEFGKIAAGIEGLRDADAVLKIKKGEPAETAIAELDSKIDALKVKQSDVRKKKRTKSERQAKAESQIRAMAARGKPDVSQVAYSGPVKFAQTKVGRTGFTFEYANDGAALVAWLFEDDLLLKVDSLFDESDAADSMSIAAQLRTLDEIQDALLALHRDRAAIVNKLAAEGQEIHHRADAPFEAVLMVEIL
jgi:hypothetical protein